MVAKKSAIIATGVALIGVGVGVWALLPSGSARPGQRAEPSQTPREESADQQVESTYALTSDENERDDAIDQALETLRSSWSALGHQQRLAPDREAAFVEEVGEVWRIYLGADFDRYVRYMEKQGKEFDPKMLNPEAGEPGLREFWLSTVKGVAGRPIDPTSARVLPRWLAGQEIEHPSLTRDVGRAFDPDRPEPKFTKQSVYEALLTVDYKWGQYQGRIDFGVALIWDDGRQSWLPWELSTYNTYEEAARVIGPTF